jgi:hypothetical protein
VKLLRYLYRFIHCLLGGRDYKVVGGHLYVREGFGDFEEIEDHLKREHLEAYKELNEDECKEAR